MLDVCQHIEPVILKMVRNIGERNLDTPSQILPMQGRN